MFTFRILHSFFSEIIAPLFVPLFKLRWNKSYASSLFSLFARTFYLTIDRAFSYILWGMSILKEVRLSKHALFKKALIREWMPIGSFTVTVQWRKAALSAYLFFFLFCFFLSSKFHTVNVALLPHVIVKRRGCQECNR